MIRTVVIASYGDALIGAVAIANYNNIIGTQGDIVYSGSSEGRCAECHDGGKNYHQAENNPNTLFQKIDSPS